MTGKRISRAINSRRGSIGLTRLALRKLYINVFYILFNICLRVVDSALLASLAPAFMLYLSMRSSTAFVLYTTSHACFPVQHPLYSLLSSITALRLNSCLWSVNPSYCILWDWGLTFDQWWFMLKARLHLCRLSGRHHQAISACHRALTAIVK